MRATYFKRTFMNSRYWTGVTQTLANLRDIFNKMAEAKGSGTQGKMYQINVNQPKTILDFRAMALRALHRLYREAECKPPGFYCRICHLGGFCSSLAAPGHVPSPHHTPCAAPSRHLPPGRRVRLMH